MEEKIRGYYGLMHCPFCGSEDIEESYPNPIVTYIKCRQCKKECYVEDMT